MVATQVYRPDLLPDGLRPKVRTQVVEVKTAGRRRRRRRSMSRCCRRTAASPAFILTVDGTTKNFTVRRVGATPEPGKSYELWLVSDKLQRPRSLGVIGGNDFTTRPALASYDADTVNKATFAVTVEPEGGSPTGVATGPIVFTGKLIEAVPRRGATGAVAPMVLFGYSASSNGVAGSPHLPATPGKDTHSGSASQVSGGEFFGDGRLLVLVKDQLIMGADVCIAFAGPLPNLIEVDDV